MWHIAIILLTVLIIINILVIYSMIALAHEINDLEYFQEIDDNEESEEK